MYPSDGHLVTESDIEPFVRLALACIHREFPHHMVHVVANAGEIRRPCELHPAFYGCFDWHSAVHSHWTLVRAVRLFPHAPWVQTVREALARNLTEANLSTETDYLRAPGRDGFERPYGLAWLLQLGAELREFDDREDRRWLQWLAPLELIAVEQLSSWLPKLAHPIRSGEHSQTSFAMGLALDWARAARSRDFERLLSSRARDFHHADRGPTLMLEPSAHDFLSPTLAAADLKRRVLSSDEFARWLTLALPEIPSDASSGWLLPTGCPDPSDGKLSHLDGLNLSRAWMLEGIASALPASDPRIPALLASARSHSHAGLAAICASHYAGAHWLGSFAVYLLTQRGFR